MLIRLSLCTGVSFVLRGGTYLIDYDFKRFTIYICKIFLFFCMNFKATLDRFTSNFVPISWCPIISVPQYPSHSHKILYRGGVHLKSKVYQAECINQIGLSLNLKLSGWNEINLKHCQNKTPQCLSVLGKTETQPNQQNTVLHIVNQKKQILKRESHRTNSTF